MKHFPVVALIGLVVFVLFPSCSAQINGRLVQDGSGNIQLQAGLEPNMTTLIRSFSALGGGTVSTGPMLNADSLNRTLRSAPGVASSALRNSGQEKVEGTIGISRIGDLLSAGDNRFIRYEGPAGAAPGRLGIHLDRSLGPRILPLISPEALDYLSALMAPVATGEALTKTAYLALVESVYGRGISSEIASSRIRAVIELPGQVQSVKGGTSSGREARFDVPLLDILVLETPLDYEVTWK
jgi:hypothetical protein